MVTLPGDTLASRVASSLLAVLGCPELVASSYDDYVAKARHPEPLAPCGLRLVAG
jgi:predicted O-linked N-acetylglucosamine transferase (SPINDLY family)